MRYTFRDVRRIFVCGGSRSLRAPTLINRDVHEHTAWPHLLQHLSADQLGCLGAWHEHGSDQKVNVRQKLHQVRLARIERMRGMERDIEKAHAFKIDFENSNVGTQPSGHARRIDSRTSTPKD